MPPVADLLAEELADNGDDEELAPPRESRRASDIAANGVSGGTTSRGRDDGDSLLMDLTQVLDMIARGAALKKVFQKIRRSLEQQNPDAVAAVWLLEGSRLRCLAGQRLPESYVAAVDGSPVDADIGVFVDAIRKRQSVFVDDLAAGGHANDPALAHGLGACWANPIVLSTGEIAGAFTIYHPEPVRATLRERRLLAEAATVAGIAIGQRRVLQMLHFQANHDPLTGLPNRALMMRHLSESLKVADSARSSAALMLLDLDNFKFVNDSLGHGAGDDLLKQVARRLSECVRASDTVARPGGDEFVVLLPLATPDEASRVAEKLLRSMEPAFSIEGRELFVTPSIGLSMYPDHGTNPEGLLQAADAAMYRAKHDGKNAYRFYLPTMNAEASTRLELESQLRRALQDRQFLLHYQPKIDLDTGQFTGVEALVRWRHPEYGLIPPSQFIPVAEQTGIILELGTWVLWEACRQTKQWQDEGLGGIKVAVNLSGVQFRNHELPDVVAEVLRATSLHPRFLEFEITENMLMENDEEVVVQMEKLKALKGLKLSIDDFGTGYSSLAYLKLFPVDSLKIDRTFVKDLEASAAGDAADIAIVKTIITLGHSLGLTVIGEGVEEPGQAEILRSLNCNEAQGYYYSRPLPADQLAELVRRGGGQLVERPRPSAPLAMPTPLPWERARGGDPRRRSSYPNLTAPTQPDPRFSGTAPGLRAASSIIGLRRESRSGQFKMPSVAETLRNHTPEAGDGPFARPPRIGDLDPRPAASEELSQGDRRRPQLRQSAAFAMTPDEARKASSRARAETEPSPPTPPRVGPDGPRAEGSEPVLRQASSRLRPSSQPPAAWSPGSPPSGSPDAPGTPGAPRPMPAGPKPQPQLRIPTPRVSSFRRPTNPAQPTARKPTQEPPALQPRAPSKIPPSQRRPAASAEPPPSHSRKPLPPLRIPTPTPRERRRPSGPLRIPTPLPGTLQTPREPPPLDGPAPPGGPLPRELRDLEHGPFSHMEASGPPSAPPGRGGANSPFRMPTPTPGTQPRSMRQTPGAATPDPKAPTPAPKDRRPAIRIKTPTASGPPQARDSFHIPSAANGDDR